MNAVLTYIFKHKHYNNIIAAYNEAITNFSHAYKIWLEHEGLQDSDDFGFKEIVAKNLLEIKTINTWLNTSTNIRNTKREALIWFFNEKGLSSIPELHYNEYRVISEHESYIGSLQEYLNTYSQLVNNHKAAIDRYLQVSKDSHSYEEIKRIVSSKDTIEKYSTVMSNAHVLQTKHYYAWKIFANGRSLNDIPISELEDLNQEDFDRKNSFLFLYSQEPELIKLILGDSFFPIDSFEEAALEQEEDITVMLASRNLDLIEPYNANLQLENPKELKRAILDSVKYGESCNFSDSYSISKFYQLRADFDRIGAYFDDAVTLVKNNDAAIKSYHQAECGQSCVYIEDYLRSVTEGSPLSLYIQTYREEKNERDEAKRIKNNYPKGFFAIFGELELDSCSIQYVESVINSRTSIQVNNEELEKIERKRLEDERKRQEALRKQQEIHDLKSCIVSWPQPRRSSIGYFSLYNYYPTNCEWNASESEWDVRNLIWDFKAKPHNYQSEEEIMRRHRRSVDAVLPQLRKVLCHYFGNLVSKLTIVPVLASTKIVSDRRYRDIMERICSELGLYNGYPHLTIKKEGISKNDPSNNTGHSIPPEVEYDHYFFKDKYVILFDDVITSGASMERCKCLLEATGATVIGGLSLGKTKHERQYSNPIDQL